MRFVAKIFAILLVGALPAKSYCFGETVNQLLAEKQQKIEALEKCNGNRKGFMVAGISTIGLMGIGVVGNVALINANKRATEELAAEKQKNAPHTTKPSKDAGSAAVVTESAPVVVSKDDKKIVPPYENCCYDNIKDVDVDLADCTVTCNGIESTHMDDDNIYCFKSNGPMPDDASCSVSCKGEDDFNTTASKICKR